MVPEKHVHYMTEPLKGFIFTLSADSGLQIVVFIKTVTDKWLSVRDKIMTG